MPIRTLEHGFDKTTLSYVTPEACEKKAREIADKLNGMCNVQIVPVVPGNCTGNIRYTAIFSCFELESDMTRILFLCPEGKAFQVHR